MNPRARPKNSLNGAPASHRAVVVALLALWCAVSVSAQHQPHGTSTAASEEGIQLSIPDLLLLDQNGREVRFYSELVKGRVVAINFIFTTCTTICPLLGANFGQVQSLVPGVGKDFHLISVSVDPLTDTPERLRAWAQKSHARPGWTLVTGRKADVDRLLKALHSFTPNKQDHTPIVWIGDAARNMWTRANGLASPAQLAEIAQRYLGEPGRTRPGPGTREK